MDIFGRPHSGTIFYLIVIELLLTCFSQNKEMVSSVLARTPNLGEYFYL